MSQRYIPWNESTMCTLLNLVITEGAHIAETREVKKKWNAVNDAFFNQNELLEYKATLYKKDDPRKIRDKYDKMLREIKELRSIHAHKLFSAMEKWRRQCEPVPSSVSSSTTTSSSTNVSLVFS